MRSATVEIYDDIGPAWAGGIDAGAVAKRLAQIGDVDELFVRVNSRGGSAYDGMAMFQLLLEHPAKKVGAVLGVAASAATLPLMACSRIHVPRNGLLMIHDPSIVAEGNEREIEAALAQLRSLKEAVIDVYAQKTGLPTADIRKMMADETWMNGQDAVRLGFADTEDAPVTVPTSAAAALSLSGAIPFKFSRAPGEFNNLLAMSAGLKSGALPVPSVPVVTPAPAPAPELAGPATDVVLAERHRISDIKALCDRAGRPELAADWIERGVPVASVQQAMRDILCQQRPPVGDDCDQMTGSGGRYAREYAAGRETYQAAGITPEQFEKSRRIDDGLETLLPAEWN